MGEEYGELRAVVKGTGFTPRSSRFVTWYRSMSQNRTQTIFQFAHRCPLRCLVYQTVVGFFAGVWGTTVEVNEWGDAVSVYGNGTAGLIAAIGFGIGVGLAIQVAIWLSILVAGRVALSALSMTGIWFLVFLSVWLLEDWPDMKSRHNLVLVAAGFFTISIGPMWSAWFVSRRHLDSDNGEPSHPSPRGSEQNS